MSYRFRLTFYHSRRGLFRCENDSQSFLISEGMEVTVVARDSSSLAEATRYHMEAGGFKDEAEARTAGERLRLCLRVLNAMLGVGISVPAKDNTSGGVSTEFKEKMYREHGIFTLDTIVGLAVFPDDEHYIEMVMAGEAEVHPSDPMYLLTALSKIWPIEVKLDERSQAALEILNHAIKESSPRSKFLLTYLAVEQMIERGMRSNAAVAVISQLQDYVRAAKLKTNETDSLIGAIAALRERSLSSALMDLGRRIQSTETYNDEILSKFLSSCIRVRNRIAHNAAMEEDIDLNRMSDALRKFCMSLIWTYNRIPNVSVDVPGSVVLIPNGGISIRAL